MFKKARIGLSVVISFMLPLVITACMIFEKEIVWLQGDGSGIVVCLFLILPVSGALVGLMTCFENKKLLIPELIALVICVISVFANKHFGAWVFPSFIFEWLIGACFPFLRMLKNKS